MKCKDTACSVKVLQSIILSFSPGWLSHRVFSDEVNRLFVMLSYFGPDRLVQILSLIPILI